MADTLRVATAGVRGVTTSGIARPQMPSVALALASEYRRWGSGPAIGFSVGKVRNPANVALIDPRDPIRPIVSFDDIEHRCDALAKGLLDRGLGPGVRVGLLGRNSRPYIETMVAVARTGADLVCMPTGASAETINNLCMSERLSLILRDEEFAGRVPSGIQTISVDSPSGVTLLDSLPTKGRMPKPQTLGSLSLLTPGSAGLPLGSDKAVATLDSFVALLDALPLRQGGTTLIAAPLFHSWGWMHHRIANLLDSTQIVVPTVDAEEILSLVDKYQVDTLVTLPVAIRRLNDLPRTVRRKYDITSLTCVASSGASLTGDAALAFMDAYSEVLYNVYGTAEATFASVATPQDLRESPGTVGRALPGIRLDIFDRRGRAVEPGVEGRVHLSNRSGSTGALGATRARVKGMIFTGDIGSFDDEGRLRIVGRADDVVVTGGEDVHPAEVEDVLRQHPSIREVAVTGTPDPVYGASLVAHIVVKPRQKVDQEEVLAWARERLGPHHRPRLICLHKDLPRNDTGGVMRRALVGDGSGQLEDELD